MNIFESVITENSLKRLHCNLSKKKKIFVISALKPNEVLLNKSALAIRACDVCWLTFEELLKADLARRSHLYNSENQRQNNFLIYLSKEVDSLNEFREIQEKQIKRGEKLKEFIGISAKFKTDIAKRMHSIHSLNDKFYTLDITVQDYCLGRLFLSLQDLFSGKNTQKEIMKEFLVKAGIGLIDFGKITPIITIISLALEAIETYINQGYDFRKTNNDLNSLDEFIEAAFKWSVSAKLLTDIYGNKKDLKEINSEVVESASIEIQSRYSEY